MFEIILFEPEIPPNTGNIIRLCANTGTRLNLVEPLGFKLDDKQLLRAGLDYHEFAQIRVHPNWKDCLHHFEGVRIFALSTKGSVRHDSITYREGDAFLLGPESRGLPENILNSIPGENRIRIPMLPESRSLNLSNSASIMIYEAWRQGGFRGGI
jgi:tRNA (cytidine/uridine-2'-O-)-methyltransferase